MFVSCASQETGEVDSDMLKLTQVDRKKGTLNFAVDLRSDFAQNIKSSKKGCVSVYFPLSREKMKFVGLMLNTESENAGENELAKNLNLDISGLKKSIWERLGVEERKTYKSAQPDLLLAKNDVMNTFNSPEVTNIPENFSVLVIYPEKGKARFHINSLNNFFLVEHTVYTMPQVIADKRQPDFESLFKPYKKAKKFTHEKNANDEWIIKNVNPW